MAGSRTDSIIHWILLACVLAVIALFSLTKPIDDFVEYWVSSHSYVAGHNPYSLPDTMEREQALGWAQPFPLMNLNPPWAMPLFAPLGYFKSYSSAWFVWVMLMSLVLAVCARLLLDTYSAGRRIFPDKTAWGESVLAFTFYPALLCLKFTQITVLALLGLAAFLTFERRGQPFWCGVSLVFIAFKPHLVYLVGIALLLDFLKKPNWKLPLGFVTAIAALSLISVAIRPSIFSDYWTLSHSGYVKNWPSALGSLLRWPLGNSDDSFLLQFVPPVFGLCWFVFFWLRIRSAWNWKDHLPVLLTVSVFTAPYGWIFDQVLLLLPVVALASALTRTYGAIPKIDTRIYTLMNALIIVGATSGRGRWAYIVAPIALLYALGKGAPSTPSMSVSP